jgi:hypothetical protein
MNGTIDEFRVIICERGRGGRAHTHLDLPLNSRPDRREFVGDTKTLDSLRTRSATRSVSACKPDKTLVDNGRFMVI